MDTIRQYFGEDVTTTQVAIAVAAVLATLYILLSRSASSGKPAVWHKVRARKFLNKQRQQLTLKFRENVTHDTVRFRFGLPSATPSIGLPVGKAIKFFVPNIAHQRDAEEWNPRPANEARGTPAVPKDAGTGSGDLDKHTGEWKEIIERKYTPCTLDSDLGHVDFIIKVYRADTSPIFPHGGKCSQYMDSLQVGDTVDIQGPFGVLVYEGLGTWKKYGRKSKVGLIAGGSGVTPMLQVIQSVLTDPDDDTELSLIYANKTEDDIIVKDMLDQMAANSDGQFRVHYTLDNPPDNWDGSSGFVTADMIAAHLPAPSDETLVLMCGPPPMIKFACRPNLEKLGYDSKTMVGSF